MRVSLRIFYLAWALKSTLGDLGHSSCEKVMFSQASVILSTEGGIGYRSEGSRVSGGGAVGYRSGG